MFALGLAILALPALGYLRITTATFLFAAVVAPFPIIVWSPEIPSVTGIAHNSLSVTTYTLTLCFLTLGLVRQWKRNAWLMAYGLAITAYLLIGLLTVWSGAEAQWAGAIHWMFALLALVAGYQFGWQLTPYFYRQVIGLLLGLFAINGLLCIAQLAGLPVSLFPAQYIDNIADGRPIGSFSHPSTLGKFVLISLILVLPALRSSDYVSRRLAWACVGLAVPLVALTLARANLTAVGIAILLWLVFESNSWTRKPLRVALLLLVFALSAPIISATLERFSTDPGGGDRGRIYRAGLEQIQSNFWAGTGPNFYVEIVGQWDQMTAWGYPLHNSFLYPVAELGIIGGVLFMLPVFVVGAIAVVDCVGSTSPSPWSKAYLVTFPGMMIIAMTGWGMLIGSTLCLWFFAIGLCAGGITQRNSGLFPSTDSVSPSVGQSLPRFVSGQHH